MKRSFFDFSNLSKRQMWQHTKAFIFPFLSVWIFCFWFCSPSQRVFFCKDSNMNTLKVNNPHRLIKMMWCFSLFTALSLRVSSCIWVTLCFCSLISILDSLMRTMRPWELLLLIIMKTITYYLPPLWVRVITFSHDHRLKTFRTDCALIAKFRNFSGKHHLFVVLSNLTDAGYRKHM